MTSRVKIYPPTPSHPRYRLVWHDADGKRRMRSIAGEAEAHAEATEIDVKIRLGAATTATGALTLRTAWHKYLAEKSSEISTEYLRQLQRFEKTDLKPLLSLKLNNLTKQKIQATLNNKKPGGPRRRFIERLRPFLRWAHRTDLLHTPPSRLLENLQYGEHAAYQPKRGSAETVRHFTMAEVYAIAKATNTLWQTPAYQTAFPDKGKLPDFCETTALMVLLAASTGLRQGEIKALQTNDLDRLDVLPTTLSITKQAREHAGGGREIARPKNGKTRTVTIPLWTAPTQDTHPEYFRTSHDILQKFGAPPTTQTFGEFLAYRYAWLEKKLATDYPGIKIHPPKDLYNAPLHATRDFLNFDINKSVCQLNKNTYVSLGALHVQHTTATPTNNRIWSEFADSGKILPLREMLMWHVERIKQIDQENGSLWKNHPEAKKVDKKTLLLWPAMRPPRKNTPIPSGTEFVALPHNGVWVPQQLTRDFIRRAIEDAGIHEVAAPHRTRRTFRELRHTFAVTALRQGSPISVVTTQLGHANPAITLQRYANHMIPKNQAPNLTL